jgi:tetratricopeptide (TPR) repeat protein
VSTEAFGGNDTESYYDEGLTAAMKGDLKRAILFFDKAIKLDKSFASAYHQLGKCYLRIGNIARAISMLSQVSQARPMMIAAKIDLGNALALNGDDEQARAIFNLVLSTDPDNRKALIGLSQASFTVCDWQQSLEYAQQAQEVGGTNFSTCYLIGRTAKILGKTEMSQLALKKADMLMEKFEESNEEKPEGQYLRGEVAFVQERYNNALEFYRKAEDRMSPETFYLAYGESFSLVDVIAKQGLCLQRLDKHDRAHEIGVRVQQMNPEHPICKALLDSGE